MLDELLKDPSKIGAVALMAIAVWAFFTNKIVTAQTLAERDKQIVALQQRYDEVLAFAFRLADITDRSQSVAAKVTGIEKP